MFVLSVIQSLSGGREKGNPKNVTKTSFATKIKLFSLWRPGPSQFHFIYHHTAFMGHMGIVSYTFRQKAEMSIMKHAKNFFYVLVPVAGNCKLPFFFLVDR